MFIPFSANVATRNNEEKTGGGAGQQTKCNAVWKIKGG